LEGSPNPTQAGQGGKLGGGKMVAEVAPQGLKALKTVELRKSLIGGSTRWRKVEEDGQKLVGGVCLRRRDPDQAAQVVRKRRSGRRPVRLAKSSRSHFKDGLGRTRPRLRGAKRSISCQIPIICCKPWTLFKTPVSWHALDLMHYFKLANSFTLS